MEKKYGLYQKQKLDRVGGAVDLGSVDEDAMDILRELGVDVDGARDVGKKVTDDGGSSVISVTGEHPDDVENYYDGRDDYDEVDYDELEPPDGDYYDYGMTRWDNDD